MRRVLSVLLVLLWMFFIFANSNATGVESSSLSDNVLENIVVICTNIKRDSQEMEKVKKKYGIVIRKFAHFFVYFVLGILVMNALYSFNVNRWMIIYASLICIIYAISDEFHQTFISGRSGQLRDVLLDSSGSLLANYFMYKFVVLRNYEKKSR